MTEDREPATRDPMPRDWPDHWTWHEGPVEPAPAAIVDIDGVLSDAANRQHYLERPAPNWRAFFDACGDDEVIDEVKVLVDHLDPALAIVLLTARPARVHHLTEAWLRRYRIRWDLLVMRPWGDYAQSPEFKAESVEDLRRYGFDLRIAFEDDRRNVDMFHAVGVPCVYIHSGYYD